MKLLPKLLAATSIFAATAAIAGPARNGYLQGRLAGCLADGGSRADHRPQSDRREEPGVGLGEAEPLTRQERPEPYEWGQDKGKARQDCPPSLTAASAGRGAAPHIRRLAIQERPAPAQAVAGIGAHRGA
jgi:hypothetical protein